MPKEEKKNSPSLNLKDLKIGASIELQLNMAKEITTGEGKYGDWFLWSAMVEDAPKVYEGRGREQTELKDYTGEVVFFPTEKVHEKLIELADGNKNVKVSITKEVEEGPKGLFRKYVVEKLSDGVPDIGGSNLTETETNFLADAEDLSKDNYEISEEEFITSSQEECYKGKISKERAKELYSKFLKMLE